LDAINLKKDVVNGQVFDSTRYNQDQSAVETAINKLINSVSDGDSGGDALKMTPITGLGDINTNTAQKITEAIFAAIQSIVLGDIPNNTLTIEKLNFDVATQAELNAVLDLIGDLSTLSTTDKTKITAAINEVIQSTANILTTKGDMLFRNTSANAVLPISDDGKILQIDAGIPSWQSLHNKQIFTADGTFTAPKTGVYKVVVIGGGGSGGRTGSSSNVYASAGGAGGIAIKWVTLTKNDAVTVTRGAGGAAYTTSSAGGSSGNNGGTSSFGSHCSATGGSGGAPSASGSSGATGGDGSGGDINIQSPVGFPTFQATAMFPAPHVGTSMFGLLYGKGGTGSSGLDTNGSAGGNGAVIVLW